MPSSAADYSKTSFETSSKTFSRSRKIVAELDLYPLLRVVIGAAVCISSTMPSIVPTPLLKHRAYRLIGSADHLTLASTNRFMTFEKAGSSEMGRCILSFFGIGIILAIFYLVGSLPSENDWLMSRRKWCLVASGAFLIIE